MEKTSREVLINDITEIKGLVDQCRESSDPGAKWVQALLTKAVNQKYQQLEQLSPVNTNPKLNWIPDYQSSAD